MLLLASTGHIRHGKNSLIEGFTAAEPNSEVTESSELISRVCDILNEGLIPLSGYAANDSFELLKRWNDMMLPKALDDMTPLEYDPELLVLDRTHMEQHPKSYAKLYTYLDMVIENPGMLDWDITPETKDSYRPFLQWVGGRVSECLGFSLWYRGIVRRAKVAEEDGRKLFGCSGIRFPVDEKEWRGAGGLIFDVIRPGYPEQDTDDPTEVLRQQVKKDAVVYNDGDLNQLFATARIIIDDIGSGQLRSEYHASLA